MANYYDDLIIKIEDLIKQEKYKEANSLIDEELNMPYVPMDISDKLYDLKDSIKGYLNNEKAVAILSPEQIGIYLRKDNDSAAKALETLSQVNIRNYLEVIIEALNDKDVKHIMKNILLELLVNQQINQEIIYEGKKVNPINLKPVLKQDYLTKVSSRLVKLIPSNPSFLQQAHFVMINVAYDNYPNEVKDEEIDNIAYSIIRYVFIAYDRKSEWEKFRDFNEIDENMLQTYDF